MEFSSIKHHIAINVYAIKNHQKQLLNGRSIRFKNQAYMYILQDKLHRKTFFLKHV